MKIDGFKIGGFANIDSVNLDAGQMYFGVPGSDGLARFERVNASRLKQLYRYAGDLELTFGEFMFDFMLLGCLQIPERLYDATFEDVLMDLVPSWMEKGSRLLYKKLWYVVGVLALW